MEEKPPIKTPIILFSTERSGTNLLRAMLSSHSQIASPPPSGLIVNMARHRFRYINSSAGNHIEELVQDALRLIEAHQSDWGIEIDAEDVLRRMGSTSFWEMFRTLNDIYADRHKCACWLSKEPNQFDWGYELLAHMPNARFVYLVRDGRDVAASMLKGQMHEVHVYGAARRWKRDQERCLQYLADSMFQEHIFQLRYEDLIADPEQAMHALTKFIGLEFEAGMLEFHKQEGVLEHAGRSPFWENLAKPVIAENARKYRSTLSAYQIRVFESVAWDAMRVLGYEPDNPDRKTIHTWEKRVFRLVTTVLKRVRLFKAREELGRRKAFRKVAQEISRRQFKALNKPEHSNGT